MLREDDVNSEKYDYFTISVNSYKFVFRILTFEDEPERQDLDLFIDRAEKIRNNRRTTLFMKKGFSELIEDRDISKGVNLK